MSKDLNKIFASLDKLNSEASFLNENALSMLNLVLPTLGDESKATSSFGNGKPEPLKLCL